jgi:hypothetical protein
MNALPNQPAAKPKRSWFRFTLRTFLVVVLVLGVACGWLGNALRRQQHQRRIVRQLEARGHTVAYDYQLVDGPPTPPGPWVLRGCFGDDLFAYVSHVTLSGKYERDDFRALRELPKLDDVYGGQLITDAELVAHISCISKLRTLALKTSGDILGDLSAAKELESLTLYGDKICDADLHVLPRLRKLKHLGFLRTQLTAAGMEHVSQMPELRTLRIYDGMAIDDTALIPIGRLSRLEDLALGQTGITDDGLRHLHGLNQLKKLDLRITNITDEGIAHLASFDKLQELTLNANITDAGMRKLTALQSLKYLNLPGSPVTDEGMKSLAQLHKLKELHMGRAKVTDAGILELRALHELDHVTVGSNVSLAGAAKLREHLPNCKFDGVSTNGSRSFFLPAMNRNK